MRCFIASVLAVAGIAATLHAQSVFADLGVGTGARSHRFDLLHVDIDVRFDIPRKLVMGTVVQRMRSLDPALGHITLDAGEGMRFGRVEVDGVGARYLHHGDTLDILLPAPRTYNDTFAVVMDYEITPEKGLYFIQPDSLVPGRRRQIWTQGEAEDNRYWLPVYDYPNDRATSELRATIPSEWKLLSNGSLVSVGPGATPGTNVWHYSIGHPHSTYLIMLAAGDYLVTRDTAAGVPLEYWTYPDQPERVTPTFGRTPEVMRFFVDLLGPYPWDKYAQVVIADFMYGGMENTTATTLNDYALVDERGLVDYNTDELVAHELAHQWFGDLVTNRSWEHLWLHESYATYLAARFIGRRYGEDEFAWTMYENGRIGIRSEETRGRDPLAVGERVTANIYQRGSRVLHMLNRLVGDELFNRANRLFLQRHAYGVVETNDLKLAFEDATGLNLGWFFDQWIYRAGHPHLRVEEQWSGNKLALRVVQTQSRDSLTGLFSMPVPMEFYLADGVVRDTIWVTKEDETFTFSLPERPRFTIFDAGDALLKTLVFFRPADELMAQLGAPRMIDRYQALVDLTVAGRMPARDTRERRSVALRDLFLREPSEHVREEIVNRVSQLDSGIAGEIVRRGLGDPAAIVRRAAAENSFMIADVHLRASLLRPLLADSSYSVVTSALGMLATTDTAGLAQSLRDMKGLRGRRDRLARAWLSAALAGKYNMLADDVADYTIPPFNNETRVQALYVLAKLDTITPKIRDVISRGIMEPEQRLRTAAATVARSHLDLNTRMMLEALRDTVDGEVRETIVDVLNEKRK